MAADKVMSLKEAFSKYSGTETPLLRRVPDHVPRRFP